MYEIYLRIHYNTYYLIDIRIIIQLYNFMITFIQYLLSILNRVFYLINAI